MLMFQMIIGTPIVNSQRQTMQAYKARNLLGLIAVAATAVGAYFNHNYYYNGYYGDKKSGQENQPKGPSAGSSDKKKVKVKTDNDNN